MNEILIKYTIIYILKKYLTHFDYVIGKKFGPKPDNNKFKFKSIIDHLLGHKWKLIHNNQKLKFSPIYVLLMYCT